MVAPAQIKSLEAKLTKLEQGVDFEAEAGRMGKAKNTQMFSHNGKGQAIWNGMGTTKTKQSPTLFITNIPRGKINELDTVFKLDPGFFRVRVVRHMAFVDYETVADATRAMIKHQNERMPGISLEHGGIMIDVRGPAAPPPPPGDGWDDVRPARDACQLDRASPCHRHPRPPPSSVLAV